MGRGPFDRNFDLSDCSLGLGASKADHLDMPIDVGCSYSAGCSFVVRSAGMKPEALFPCSCCYCSDH